jgi:hypothetical protein
MRPGPGPNSHPNLCAAHAYPHSHHQRDIRPADTHPDANIRIDFHSPITYTNANVYPADSNPDQSATGGFNWFHPRRSQFSRPVQFHPFGLHRRRR